MAGSLAVIAWFVLWFSLNPSSAGKWFFFTQQKYIELKNMKGQQHEK